MTPPTKFPGERLAELEQMCAAPSDGYSAGAWCEAASDLLERTQTFLGALVEIHEFTCGCDRPGNPMACICEPVEEFKVLAPYLGREAS